MIEPIEFTENIEPNELTENVSSKTNKIDLFKELANFDPVLGTSRFVF
jgi:hypothetical protein